MELWQQARLATLPARSPRALSAPAICRNVDVSTHDGFEALMKQTGALPRSPLGKRVRGSRVPPVPQAATLERMLENMTPRGDDRQPERRGQTRITPRRDARDPLPSARAMSARHRPCTSASAGEPTVGGRKPSVGGGTTVGPRKLSVASSVASVARELAAERERKEVLTLFEIYKAQSRPSLGMRAARSFDAVLRSSYPNQSGGWIAAQLRLVRSEQQAAERKQWMARARALEPEIGRLFG